MSDILSNFEDIDNENNEYEDIDIVLSNHMTCSAHILNLVATTDTSKITDLKYKKISRSAFGKLSSFWNLLSKSTMASDTVYKICQCKFPIPVVTRWNSFFDSNKKIVHCCIKVNNCFEQLYLCKFKVAEWNFLVEYIKVMEPLIIALDKLQGEKSCYLGYVTPTIITLRHILIEQNHLVCCASLSSTIIHGLENRYSFLFNLKDPKSKPYILAAVNHPKFKMHWVPQQFFAVCKQLFISEGNEIGSLLNIETGNSSVSLESDKDNDSEDDFYSFILPSSQSSGSFDSSFQREDNIASVLRAIFFEFKTKKRRERLDILRQLSNSERNIPQVQHNTSFLCTSGTAFQ